MTNPTEGRPEGSRERMSTSDPDSKTTAAEVQRGNTTRNPDAKVPSDLYPDPPGVAETLPGAPDD
ncbi:hypothetical protein [Paracraurococcus ruber]|uniref:Uncharacterized protein n=1 Tax=Paracraurococcus ruber TaxID=77675 RepID=A0ABS1CY01_9PROT|nr:hypothetical protein [Paracraurococcus ruber]MBK1659091.1 hypothetical protein [Paracraurococcus ruber]TDG32539.1 hypothetical protein E2C05_06780 [Paracraurococcus ruber]